MELSSCGQEMIPCGESDEECGGSNPSDDDGEGKASNSRKKNLKSEKDKQRKPSGRYKKKSHIRGETPDPNDRRTHPAPNTYKNTLPIAFVHFQAPPHDPSLDIATPIGRISQNNFNRLVHAFIMDLCPQKRYKAIIAKDLYDEIVRTLTDVGGSDARAEGVQKATPQFRFWCKKQFELTDDGRLKHENRLVAKKEDFYEIVTSSHEAADHGGRDKTMAMVSTKRHAASVLTSKLIPIGLLRVLCRFVKPGLTYLRTSWLDSPASVLAVLLLEERRNVKVQTRGWRER